MSIGIFFCGLAILVFSVILTILFDSDGVFKKKYLNYTPFIAGIVMFCAMFLLSLSFSSMKELVYNIKYDEVCSAEYMTETFEVQYISGCGTNKTDFKKHEDNVKKLEEFIAEHEKKGFIVKSRIISEGQCEVFTTVLMVKGKSTLKNSYDYISSLKEQ